MNLEAFEKVAKPLGYDLRRNEYGYIFLATADAFRGFNSRQPEIDALKAEREKVVKQSLRNDEISFENASLQRELRAHKAEVERLRADAELYGWLCYEAVFDYDYMSDRTWIKFPRLCRNGKHDHAKQAIDEKIADSIQLDAAKKEAEAKPAPRFQNVTCSNCGGEFGPGDHGFSHCESHQGKRRIR